MSVLFTLFVLAAVATWALAIYRRLDRERKQIKIAWQRLEADRTNDAIRNVYNNHVARYNAALEAFPAYLIAPLSGLKPARRYEPDPHPGSET